MSTPVERAAAARSSGPTSSPKIAAHVGPKRPAEAEASTAAAKRPMFKKEKNLASDGHASTREADDKAMRYVRVLQEGAHGVPGILSTYDGDGEVLIPYMHQRQAVKKAAEKHREYILLAHDAGTGKTATFFQLLAAMELIVGGGACCIITVPPATLPQWEETAHDWLNLKQKKHC